MIIRKKKKTLIEWLLATVSVIQYYDRNELGYTVYYPSEMLKTAILKATVRSLKVTSLLVQHGVIGFSLCSIVRCVSVCTPIYNSD